MAKSIEPTKEAETEVSDGDGFKATYDCMDCPAYCCSVWDYIEITVVDIRLLAVRLGITQEAFTEQYTLKDDDSDNGGRLLKLVPDKLLGQCCILLDQKTRLCTVHEDRPMVCREYPHTFLDETKNDCNYYNLYKHMQKEQGKRFLPLIQIGERKRSR